MRRKEKRRRGRRMERWKGKDEEVDWMRKKEKSWRKEEEKEGGGGGKRRTEKGEEKAN